MGSNIVFASHKYTRDCQKEKVHTGNILLSVAESTNGILFSEYVQSSGAEEEETADWPELKRAAADVCEEDSRRHVGKQLSG